MLLTRPTQGLQVHGRGFHVGNSTWLSRRPCPDRGVPGQWEVGAGKCSGPASSPGAPGLLRMSSSLQETALAIQTQQPKARTPKGAVCLPAGRGYPSLTTQRVAAGTSDGPRGCGCQGWPPRIHQPPCARAAAPSGPEAPPSACMTSPGGGPPRLCPNHICSDTEGPCPSWDPGPCRSGCQIHGLAKAN